MRNLLILILWLFAGLMMPTYAQDCASEASADQMEFLAKKEPLMRSFDNKMTRGIYDFPVKVGIVTKSDGSGGLTKEQVVNEIKELNDHFIHANIRFVLLDDIKFIRSDEHYNFNSSKEKEFGEQYDTKHVINIYFFNAVYKFGYNVCGYAPYPSEYSAQYNQDRVMMRNDCALNGATLIHEMGHFFSLYHTHGQNTKAGQKELVTRSVGARNCETAGDMLCDTPADPKLKGKVDAYCNYKGGDRDVRGEAYTPNPRNIMAYSVMGCRDEMTKGQYGRMNYAALKFRSYIKFPEGAKPYKGEQTVPTTNTEIAVATPPKPPRPPKATNVPPVQEKPKPVRPEFEEPKTVTKPAKPVVTTERGDLSGELTLQIVNHKVPISLDGNLFKTDESYYAGTSYELFIKNNEAAYVYVVGSDLSRQNSLLFPTDYNSPALNQAFSKFALPGNKRMFTLDKRPGKDYLLVLYSTKPLPIKNMMYQMSREDGNFIQRLYQVMGDDLVPMNQVSYNDDNNGTMGFNATTNNRSIVPIVLEIDHL